MERKEINASGFDWNAIFQHVVADQTTVESLGDDVDSFAGDIERAMKELPAESDPWAS